MTTTVLPDLGLKPDRDVLALVANLAAAHLGRAVRSDAANARRVLAAHGVWTLGVAEAVGGGGADHPTTAYTLAEIAAAWPSVALACAHAHAGAAAVAEATSSGLDLAEVHEQGRPLAVLDAVDGRIDTIRETGRTWIAAPRIDVTGEADLVIAFADEIAVVPAAAVRFSRPVRTTGLRGAHTVSVGAWVEPRHWCGDAALSVQLRTRLHSGIAAVAAGIAGAAAAYSRRYAHDRVQFGAPLTAIPTVREALVEQENATMTALLHACARTTTPHDLLTTHRALDAAVESATCAVQILGGYGYLAEHPVEEYLRDAISLRAAADAAWSRASAAVTWATPDRRYVGAH